MLEKRSNDFVATGQKIACITLDLEQDYGRVDTYNTFDRINELCEIVKAHDIKLTAFIVGKILDQRHGVVDALSGVGTEFELHSYSHDLVTPNDFSDEVQKSKKAYIDYFGVPPLGYRSPQCRVSPQHFEVLARQGFVFDSSVVPSWRPGVYSNMSAPSLPYYTNGLIEIPFSVIPAIHLPLTMSYIKVFGKMYRFLLTAFGFPRVLIFNFHLHDIFSTASLNQLPFAYQIFHRRNAKNALEMLKRFFILLKHKGYEFLHMKRLVEMI